MLVAAGALSIPPATDTIAAMFVTRLRALRDVALVAIRHYALPENIDMPRDILPLLRLLILRYAVADA